MGWVRFKNFYSLIQHISSLEVGFHDLSVIGWVVLSIASGLKRGRRRHCLLVLRLYFICHLLVDIGVVPVDWATGVSGRSPRSALLDSFYTPGMFAGQTIKKALRAEHFMVYFTQSDE